MKRLHVHVSVDDLAQSIRFYSTLFAAEPTVAQARLCEMDARRSPGQLRDQQTRRRRAGISHLGIQAEDGGARRSLRPPQPRRAADVEAKAATCCYAQSDKQWIADPQGVPWETFFTYGEATVYGQSSLGET